MENRFIGREEECKILEDCYRSGKAEFVAVFGRRRIGKTYLVKQFFKDRIDFYVTGIYEGKKSEQLAAFNKALNQYDKDSYPLVDNWFDAFEQLKSLISHSSRKRVVVFIDELPWFDTGKSRFAKALELFWNSWGADQTKLMLVVCGSATTWMTQKLIGSKGGLYNRITRSIRLAPFTLKETAEFIASKNLGFNVAQVVECYMILGGTPYYLDLLKKGLSLSQNIDALFFASSAPLRIEYKFLFQSLFKDSNNYARVITLLSKKLKGMTQKEIKDELKLSDGGNLTEILNNLCDCEFIRKYSAFGKNKREAMYQLIDIYSLFYLRFVGDDQGKDPHYWSNINEASVKASWQGYAFENVCLHHLPQIRVALGIQNIITNACSWMSNDKNNGAQIDLVLERNDQVVDLCEIKYCNTLYEISKEYANKMTDRINLFKNQTKTRKALHLVMITPFGLKSNLYQGIVQNEITLDDLMK